MKDQNKIYEKLRDYKIRDTRKFILNNKENIYFFIEPGVIDKLCGLQFEANNSSIRKLKIEKRKEMICNGEELYKFSLIRKTNYFSGSNLIFVVFNPNFYEFYADFVFKTENGSLIALRTRLPESLGYYAIDDTRVVLEDIYEVNCFDDLLCGKTFAYPIEAYSKNVSRTYGKHFKTEVIRLLSNYREAYGGDFDDSKQTRVKNYKRFVKRI